MSAREFLTRQRLSREGALNRWGLSAILNARLPEVRGRDRLLALVRGSMPPLPLRRDVGIRWGPGLHTTINPALDGSLSSLYETQWVRPALVPVLEACLHPGDTFLDVGANVGIYTTWAAQLVGATGTVVAVEPVDSTRVWLEQIIAENNLENVEVCSAAMGAEPSVAWMTVPPGASGLASLTGDAGGDLEVSVTTIDEVLGSRRPALIKIDVEGHELAVLEGGRKVLSSSHPPLVFEAPDFGGGSGTSGLIRYLKAADYRIYSLMPGGLREFEPQRHSHNLLALSSGATGVADALKSVCFPRNQNT